MKFNINDHVRVRLTESGRSILRESERSIPPEEDGWSRWQLWVLMEVFGPSISIGMFPPLFETEIELMVDAECATPHV